MKIYLCKRCKNLIHVINDSGVNPVCCGEPMVELKANVEDASNEKHVPVVNIESNKVTVTIGSVIHPMEEKHYITCIILRTTNGERIKRLAPNMEPKAIFMLDENEKVLEAYEYCNLHGLWKVEL